ncbi:MAG: FxsA family protein [Bacteroidetes bacterium]|jgi:UPF0716 protein FxsA|nr:FxsA family protein [Bacteroidota bacterium]
MLARILALFLILPAVELALLMYVSTLIGFWETVAIIIVTGIVGGLLAKREGVSAWNRLNRKMAGGGLPGDELVDGVIILIGPDTAVSPYDSSVCPQAVSKKGRTGTDGVLHGGVRTGA